MNWYEIAAPETVASPAVLLFKDRVAHNINLAIAMAGDAGRLRPHVKTCKACEPVQMMMEAGISRFKCATIAEAEMLAGLQAPDILLAYQPVGPALTRWIQLITTYPALAFSCLADDPKAVDALAAAATAAGKIIHLWIDVNVGQNRTGIQPAGIPALLAHIGQYPSLVFEGLHCYDGHLHMPDLAEREKAVADAFEPVVALLPPLEKQAGKPIAIIAGGSPTFSIHAKGTWVCSPGTFIYWDAGYLAFTEQPFLPAAVLLARVISLPAPGRICLDLGHKAVAAENEPGKRVRFLQTDELTVAGQSEEHLVLENKGTHRYETGDVLYMLPWHVCPTIALHACVQVVEGHHVKGEWLTVSRNRKINI
ncbi:MAG: D-TA family PLP-dependent enzyme [Flavihumibacter sp.]